MIFSQYLLLTTIFLLVFIPIQGKSNSKKPSTPGVLFSLDKMIQMSSSQYRNVLKKSASRIFTVNDLKKATSIRLSGSFIKNILFNTDAAYINMLLSQKSMCTFASYLDNNLLKSSINPIQNIIIEITNTNDQTETGIISKDDFLDYLYKGQCFDVGQIAQTYNAENYVKTLTAFNLPLPQKRNECGSIFNKLKTNLNLPFLCKYPETIKIGHELLKKKQVTASETKEVNNLEQAYITILKQYEQKIPINIQSYLKNLCFNLDSEDNFCSAYLTKNFWQEVIRGEHPDYLLTFRCQSLGHAPEKQRNTLQTCVTQMQSSPLICATNHSEDQSSLFPKPDCNEIQQSLSHSRLITPYQDCPARIDYENLVTFNRIFRHFSNKPSSSPAADCIYNMIEPFANLMINSDDEYVWPLSICYTNIVANHRECSPYIPGHNPSSPLAESQVMSSIIKKTKGAAASEECKIIDKVTFNPLLLEYKTGCFIVINKNKCNNFLCPRIVYYRGKQLEDITFHGELNFEYFPTSYINTQKSFEYLLEKKLLLKKSPIPNFTILRNYLKNNPDAIIHGVGCIEYIFPSQFKIMTINQCNPTPFIIDGIAETDNQTLLNIRSPADDAHTPRLVDWNFIFSAVSAYQELHPLNIWMLYGLSK